MRPGERRDVEVVVRNTGNTVWTRALYHLGDVGADDPFTAVKRISCGGNDARISSGETCRFSMTLTAPARPGEYRSNWRMIHDGKGWFGDVFVYAIAVEAVDAAVIVNQSLPAQMLPGNTAAASITVANSGSTTWAAGQYRLWFFQDARDFSPKASQITVASDVRPGGSYRFDFTLTAPDAIGTKITGWQMGNGSGRVFGQKIVRAIELSVPAVWQQAGAFLAWDAPSILPSGYHGISNFADVLRQNGVKWIALQIHNGMATTQEAGNAGGAEWVRQWHAAGFSVGGWGVERTEPEGEAALAASLIKNWNLDFYIANAELEYKCDQGADACGRSERFVNAMRGAMRDYNVSVPLALSTLGRADVPVKPWRDAGYDLLPQTYWNTYLEYQPTLSVSFWTDRGRGWPRTRIHPTIGMGAWGEGRRAYVSVAEYMDDLRAAGTLGFSVYLIETTPPGEWTAIGQGVAAGRAR